MSEAVQVEATGETVGEAKWSALRELEKLQPGIDKAAVRFQVLSEGERGLLGVGYAPARVIASVESNALVEAAEPPQEETELGGQVREIVQRILEAIGVRANLEIREDDESVVALLVGRELGLVIGKHGQTLDAIQELLRSAVQRQVRARVWVTLDVQGYRERRKEALRERAREMAARAVDEGEMELEPMNAFERKIVHDAVGEIDGVTSFSEGEEPYRRVVIAPDE